MTCPYNPCQCLQCRFDRGQARGHVWRIDSPKPKCPLIRMLDDPAWRESLKVAETPVEAEYAGVRERLEAMRPAPAGFYSARTGYEGEYRQFFGFRS